MGSGEGDRAVPVRPFRRPGADPCRHRFHRRRHGPRPWGALSPILGALLSRLVWKGLHTLKEGEEGASLA